MCIKQEATLNLWTNRKEVQMCSGKSDAYLLVFDIDSREKDNSIILRPLILEQAFSTSSNWTQKRMTETCGCDAMTF